VKQLLYITLVLGTAMSLTAQTLSFGEITLTAATPPTYVVNIVLASNGSQVAGLQFDVSVPAGLSVSNVVLAAGATATAATKEISTNTLPAANNPLGTGATAVTNGVRGIIIGAGLNDTSVSSTGGPSVIADGVVATITLTGAPTSGEVISLVNLAGTTPGGLNIAPVAVPLTIGAGSNDPGKTGNLNMFTTYLVGDTFPATGANVGTFGNNLVDINDAIQVLFTVNNVKGYTATACTDFFDAMDSFPQDTATVRGGNGVIDINDAIVTLFHVNNVSGYKTQPVRTTLGENGVCSASLKKTTADARMARPEVRGSLVVGPAQPAGNGQDRVPVYLQGSRDMARLAFSFGLGDLQSQLRFQAAPGMAPGLMSDQVRGVVVAAWVGGLDVGAGQQILLGYVVGPAGFASNLQVFGTSATGLNDLQIVGLDVSGAPLARQ